MCATISTQSTESAWIELSRSLVKLDRTERIVVSLLGLLGVKKSNCGGDTALELGQGLPVSRSSPPLVRLDDPRSYYLVDTKPKRSMLMQALIPKAVLVSRHTMPCTIICCLQELERPTEDTYVHADQ